MCLPESARRTIAILPLLISLPVVAHGLSPRPVVAQSQSSTSERSTSESSAQDNAPVLSTIQQTTIDKANRATVKSATAALKSAPDSINLLSRRADSYFNLREFDKAVDDYDRMVELNPASDASHWRRGIAYFYAKQYKKAAGQFERYHSFDDVDRENGIWRFFSQYKAYGEKKAKEGLLKYRKDDREPFPSVYKLFADELASDDILKTIAAAKIGENERQKRLFYAHLYIGLNDAVKGRKKSATRHLRKSTANKWAPTAGFGPNYMWHVGRLQLDLLLEDNRKSTRNTTPGATPTNEEKAAKTKK